MSWLTTIVKHLDYLRDRYEAFPVRDEGTLAGVSQVAGVSVLGVDLGTSQVVDQTLTLINTGSIDPSNIDLSLVQIPSVTGILDSVLRPIVETALKPVLDALPTIEIPATLAQVKLTPGDQTTSGGLLTQHEIGRAHV